MSTIRALRRIILSLLLLFTGSFIVMATFWLPIHYRRIKASAWIVTIMARLFMRINDIQFHCSNPKVIRQFEGFIFANHSTYLDIVLAVYLLPTRFVAKQEIRAIPLVGLVAAAIGCVFVKRDNKRSRAHTREKLGQVTRYPPIVLYPEGRTGRGDALQPFRYGAFEIALQNSIPILPCAIIYDRPDIVLWRGQRFIPAFWRLVSRSGPIKAEMIPLEPLYPQPGDNGVELAERTHQKMAAFLQERGAFWLEEDTISKSGEQ